jgi:hypothetical protein
MTDVAFDSRALLADIRAGLRKTRLCLVLSLTLITNFVLAVTGLVSPVGLYALLIYSMLVWLLASVLVRAGADEQELRAALNSAASGSRVVRVRTPLHVEFTPYVAAWLAWWVVSELFRAALIVYDNVALVQYVLVPVLVLATTWVRSRWTLSKSRARRTTADVLLALLFAITTVLFFFPTLAWAPYHQSALATTVRVLLFFGTIQLYDYAYPARAYVPLVGAQDDQLHHDKLLERLEGGASGSGAPPDTTSERLEQVAAAYMLVSAEHSRAHEIATLTAWVLISPLIVAIVLLVLVVPIFLSGVGHRATTPLPTPEKTRETLRPSSEARADPSTPTQTSTSTATSAQPRAAATIRPLLANSFAQNQAHLSSSPSIGTSLRSLAPTPPALPTATPQPQQDPAPRDISMPTKRVGAGAPTPYRRQVFD